MEPEKLQEIADKITNLIQSESTLAIDAMTVLTLIASNSAKASGINRQSFLKLCEQTFSRVYKVHNETKKANLN